MKTYVGVSVGLAVMITFMVPLIAWANSQDKEGREQLEKANKAEVAYGNKLCEASACVKDHLTCGRFMYVETLYGKKVLYNPSICEHSYLESKAHEEEKKVDQEIREKYAND
jgi:hypothetical protein